MLQPTLNHGATCPMVFPENIEYSALLESGYSSTGAPATNATIALGWKPTKATTTPLTDMTGHYALTIRKVDTTITVWSGGTELAAYGGAVGSTYAELVNNVLTYYGGAEEGYYSRLAIVEDSLTWESFWKASNIVTGLYVPISLSGLTLHTLLDFSNALDLGEDSSYLQFENIAPDPTFTQDGTAGGWERNTQDNSVTISGGTASWVGADQYANIGEVGDYVEGERYLTKIVIDSISTGSLRVYAVPNSNDGTTSENYGVLHNAPGTYYDIIETDEDSNQIGVNNPLATTDAVVSEFSIYHLDSTYTGPNDWTVTGTQTADTPTNNYPTFNPLVPSGVAVFGNGNRDLIGVSTGVGVGVLSMPFPETGKYYFEIDCGYLPYSVGVVETCDYMGASDWVVNQNRTTYIRTGRNLVYVAGTSTVYTTGGTELYDGQIVGILYDADAQEMEMRINNVEEYTYDLSVFDCELVYYVMMDNFTSVNATLRFHESDFTYAMPEGYTEFCAANLPDPTIPKSSTVADYVLREGTGAEASISSLDFQPDLVNGKDRDNSRSWAMFDSENGATNYLSTDSAAALVTDAQSLKTFDYAGYTLGASSVMNHSGASFIDLCLKAGVDQGFEIVTYTGTGAVQNIPHNLGKAPTFMLVKCLSNSRIWNVYHKDLGATKIIYLNLTSAASTNSLYWNDTEPNSTQFTVGTAAAINTDGDEYVAYLFTDSDIFKAFSYTGNASADGPFVNLGGKPLWWMVKNTDAVQSWMQFDSAREAVNAVDLALYPNSTSTESGGNTTDFTSQGFKIGSTVTGFNGSGNLHVGLAILESAGKYSNAF